MLDRLEDLGVAEAWRLPSRSRRAGSTPTWLNEIATLPARARVALAGSARRCAAARRRAAGSAQPMCDLVGRSRHTPTWTGCLVEVDVHEGSRATLVISATSSSTRNHVLADYDPTLPRLTVRGSELNQVWTNLIDNADRRARRARDDHDPHRARRRLRRGRHRRRRPRHPGEARRARVRAVLHHQGGRARHRTGPRHGPPHRRGPPRRQPRFSRPGRRARVHVWLPMLAADHRRCGGRRERRCATHHRGADSMSATNCTHLDSIEITELPEQAAGCEDCLATGGVWLHLRICLTCGHVGCCDDSPGKHASAMRPPPSTRSSARWSRARSGVGALPTSWRCGSRRSPARRGSRRRRCWVVELRRRPRQVDIGERARQPREASSTTARTPPLDRARADAARASPPTGRARAAPAPRRPSRPAWPRAGRRARARAVGEAAAARRAVHRSPMTSRRVRSAGDACSVGQEAAEALVVARRRAARRQPSASNGTSRSARTPCSAPRSSAPPGARRPRRPARRSRRRRGRRTGPPWRGSS